MGILERYLVRELIAPFFFSVAAFSSLFIGSDLLQLSRLIMESGAGFQLLLQLLLLRLPQIMVWIFPMAMLMATLLSLSRLSTTSEIVAMRAGGVSYTRIFTVVLLIGFIVSCLAFFVGEGLAPVANARYAQLVREKVHRRAIMEKQTNVVLREFRDGHLAQLVFAREYDGSSQSMRGVVIQEFRGQALTRTMVIEQVDWQDNAWYYSAGRAYDYLPDGRVLTATFHAVRQQLPLKQSPADIQRGAKRPEEMSWRELGQYLKLLQREGQTGREVRRAVVQWHQKLAIPLASLVFALVGAPLGIQSHRAATSRGFGLSIAIIFVYYVIMTLGASLGEGGMLPGIVAGWLQNLLLGAAGLYLVRKAGR